MDQKIKTAEFLANSPGCTVTIHGSPNHSFNNVEISEDGRLFLANLLNQLSDQQIRDLFEGIVGVNNFAFKNPENANVDTWVSAFNAKRDLINQRSCNP